MSKWGVNEYPFITGEILVSLCDDHPEILRRLTEAIRSDNEKLVQAAIETFCLLGKQSVVVYADLIDIASSRDDATKGFAIRALGETGSQDEALCDLLLGLTRHSEWFLRGYAIGAIGKLTLNPDRCLPVVIDALSDDEGSDWTVREAAVTALGQYGQAARAAIPKLTKLRTLLKQKGDFQCIKELNEALGKIKGVYPNSTDLTLRSAP
jgi:HEAT repeat protein